MWDEGKSAEFDLSHGLHEYMSPNLVLLRQLAAKLVYELISVCTVHGQYMVTYT